jgi:hypothetical protein
MKEGYEVVKQCYEPSVREMYESVKAYELSAKEIMKDGHDLAKEAKQLLSI